MQGVRAGDVGNWEARKLGTKETRIRGTEDTWDFAPIYNKVRDWINGITKQE